MRASVLYLADVDHLHVLVQVAFLRELHVAVSALVRLLVGMSPQMVKKLAQ